MKNSLLIFFLGYFLALFAGCSQEPILPAPPAEVKMFGGENEQTAKGMIEDADGSFWLIGGQLLPDEDSHDILLVHSNAAGMEINRFFFDEGENEVGQYLIRTSDGGFLIGGVVQQNRLNYFLLKLDSDLNREWFRIYPPAQVGFGWNGDVVMLGENATGYLIAFRQFWNGIDVSNINSEGFQTNLSHFLGNFSDAPFSCATRKLDGGYAFLGFNNDNRMYSLVEFDIAGTLFSSQFIQSSFASGEVNAFCQLPNGNYYFKIETWGWGDAWFMMIPGTQFVNLATGPEEQFISSVVPGNHGNLFYTGFTQHPRYSEPDGELDFFVAEFDSSGNEIRRFILDGIGQDYIAHSILLANGNFAGVGHSDSFNEQNSDMILVLPWQ